MHSQTRNAMGHRTRRQSLRFHLCWKRCGCSRPGRGKSDQFEERCWGGNVHFEWSTHHVQRLLSGDMGSFRCCTAVSNLRPAHSSFIYGLSCRVVHAVFRHAHYALSWKRKRRRRDSIRQHGKGHTSSRLQAPGRYVGRCSGKL